MKAIILAAGMGTRLGLDFPKALVEIDGKTLLEHKIIGLKDNGIDDIYVVVGKWHEKFPTDLDVKYVVNDEYATTGNSYSFKLALDTCGTDDYIVVMDGDLMLDYRIYFMIQPKFQYFVDNLNHHWMPGDIGIKTDFNNRIIDLGREYEYCSMLGMAVYPPEFVRRLYAKLTGKGYDKKDELIVYVRKLLSNFHAIPEFVPYPWVELDYQGDVTKALNAFDKPSLETDDSITLKELNSLYRGMGEFGGLHVSMRNLDRDSTIIKNSTFAVVRRNGRVVGSGRYFTDGAYAVAIWDVMVRPEYQGQGIGTSITRRLIESAEKLHPIKIFLIADPGKESFYEQFGFKITRAPAMEKRYDYDRFSPNWNG